METFIAPNTLELIILSVAAVLFIIQMIYYFGLYNRIHKRNNAVRKGDIHFTQEQPPISVIICAHNEADNLRTILPTILEQEYPQFEVIVVNDASTDETESVLELLGEKYPYLRHSFTPQNARYISHKKLALTLGVKASRYDWLVFTEADCVPASRQWLKLMARNFTSDTQIVLGYSNYSHAKGWLHKQVTFDTLLQSLRYLGFALAGKPYMGIGRNMAYRKELFFRQKGFSAYLPLQRGEDDLFINQVAQGSNMRVETDANAIMRILPVGNYREWREEKISYLVTSHFYRGIHRYLNGFETFSRLLFYVVCVVGIVYGVLNEVWVVIVAIAIVWLLRYVVQMVVINRTSGETGGEKYYLLLPVFDMLQPLQSLNFRFCRLRRNKSDFMRR